MSWESVWLSRSSPPTPFTISLIEIQGKTRWRTCNSQWEAAATLRNSSYCSFEKRASTWAGLVTLTFKNQLRLGSTFTREGSSLTGSLIWLRRSDECCRVWVCVAYLHDGSVERCEDISSDLDWFDWADGLTCSESCADIRELDVHDITELSRSVGCNSHQTGLREGEISWLVEGGGWGKGQLT